MIRSFPKSNNIKNDYFIVLSAIENKEKNEFNKKSNQYPLQPLLQDI